MLVFVTVFSHINMSASLENLHILPKAKEEGTTLEQPLVEDKGMIPKPNK